MNVPLRLAVKDLQQSDNNSYRYISTVVHVYMLIMFIIGLQLYSSMFELYIYHHAKI